MMPMDASALTTTPIKSTHGCNLHMGLVTPQTCLHEPHQGWHPDRMRPFLSPSHVCSHRVRLHRSSTHDPYVARGLMYVPHLNCHTPLTLSNIHTPYPLPTATCGQTRTSSMLAQCMLYPWLETIHLPAL